MPLTTHGRRIRAAGIRHSVFESTNSKTRGNLYTLPTKRSMGSEGQSGSSPRRGFPVSRELSQALLESMPVNVLFKDLNGRILFANQRFCRESGCRPGELIGKTDYDLFPQEMADKYRRDDADVLARGQVLHDVEQHVTPAGDNCYVEVFKAPVQDPEGHNLGVQVLFWDVTERKLADDSFENNQSRLKLLAHGLPELVLRLDGAETEANVRQTLFSIRQTLKEALSALAELADDDGGHDHPSR